MDTAQFVTARRGLSDRLTAALRALFLGLGSWRDTDLAAFVEQAVPAVEGAQQALAQLTALYIADQAAAVFGGTVAPPDLDTLALAALRAGVTPDEVYARPFVTVRTALSQGKTLDEAVELGGQRLEQIAELDLQQTYAHASRETMRRLTPDQRPKFWRRVLQGEENCALCTIASTQRYHLETLNPIHPACDCTVEAIWDRNDPGQVIDPQLLEQVHDAVEEMTGRVDRGGRAPDYRKLMTRMTGTHSELGPMLHRPGDHFDTGPTR